MTHFLIFSITVTTFERKHFCPTIENSSIFASFVLLQSHTPVAFFQFQWQKGLYGLPLIALCLNHSTSNGLSSYVKLRSFIHLSILRKALVMWLKGTTRRIANQKRSSFFITWFLFSNSFEEKREVLRIWWSRPIEQVITPRKTCYHSWINRNIKGLPGAAHGKPICYTFHGIKNESRSVRSPNSSYSLFFVFDWLNFFMLYFYDYFSRRSFSVDC